MAKRNLFIVTLESIEQRYTKQWYNSWKNKFEQWFNVEYIDGIIIDDKIDTGRFLDINKTNIWKAQQVVWFAKLFQDGKIQKGDRFLFADGWHFGIVALKYMSQLHNIPIKIYCYWHAGTWDNWDFITQVGMRDWAPPFEASLFLACDGHFVATKFHKRLIEDYFRSYYRCGHFKFNNNIHVVGFPMDWRNEIANQIGEFNSKELKKEDIILFPHRLDKEKQPHIFDQVSKLRGMRGYKFIKTLEVTKNKKEYYTLMSQAKIIFSASLQETYGIGAVEGVMLNCIPLVPNRLSYLELYPTLFRYSSYANMKEKIYYFMKHYNSRRVQSYLERTRKKIEQQSINSFKQMSRVMTK